MTTDPSHRAHSRTGWFKSSFSPSQGGCVEVRFDGCAVLVRDTKDRGTGPRLSVDIDKWPGFIAEVTGNAAAGSNHALHLERLPDGGMRLRAIGGAMVLTYTVVEWTAFAEGAAAGQFTLQPAA